MADHDPNEDPHHTGSDDAADSWPDPLDRAAHPPDAAHPLDRAVHPPDSPTARSRDAVSPATTPAGRRRRILPLIVLAVTAGVVVRVFGVGLWVDDASNATLREAVTSADWWRAFFSTSLAFIALPAGLAWFLARRPPSTTSMGRVMTGTTIALLLLATALGEAALCVAIAAPLVYLVAAVATVAKRRLQRHQNSAFLLLALLPMALAGAPDAVETVEVTRTVDLSEAELRALFATPPDLDATERPWLLTLGYPVPGPPTTRTLGDATVWTWAYGAGETVFHARPTGTGIDFDVASDTAMRRWFTWHDSTVEFTEVDSGTQVRLTLRFDPALGPDWWFGTIERRFLHAAGEQLLDGLGLVAATADEAPR